MNWKHRNRERTRAACIQDALNQSAWSLARQVDEARQSMGEFKWTRLNREWDA